MLTIPLMAVCPLSDPPLHPTHTHLNRLGLSDGWAAVSLDFVGSRFWLATAHWLLLEWSAGWHRTEFLSRGWVCLLWPGVEWWNGGKLIWLLSCLRYLLLPLGGGSVVQILEGLRCITDHTCKQDCDLGLCKFHVSHWTGIGIHTFWAQASFVRHMLWEWSPSYPSVQTLIGIWLLIVQQQQAKVPVMSLLILAHSRIPSCVCVYGGEQVYRQHSGTGEN